MYLFWRHEGKMERNLAFVFCGRVISCMRKIKQPLVIVFLNCNGKSKTESVWWEPAAWPQMMSDSLNSNQEDITKGISCSGDFIICVIPVHYCLGQHQVWSGDGLKIRVCCRLQRGITGPSPDIQSPEDHDWVSRIKHWALYTVGFALT